MLFGNSCDKTSPKIQGHQIEFNRTIVDIQWGNSNNHIEYVSPIVFVFIFDFVGSENICTTIRSFGRQLPLSSDNQIMALFLHRLRWFFRHNEHSVVQCTHVFLKSVLNNWLVLCSMLSRRTQRTHWHLFQQQERTNQKVIWFHYKNTSIFGWSWNS